MGTIEIVLIKYFMQFFRMVTNELAPPSSPVAVVAAAKSTLISLVSGSTERGRDGTEERRKSANLLAIFHCI